MKIFKKSILVIAMTLFALMIVGCTNAESNQAGETNDVATTEVLESIYPVTIVDDLGNEVTIEQEPEKLVSLAPSSTEIIFALGLGDKVIGRTEYCDYPAEAQSVEVVGGFSNPNVELIISLEPDVVFAQGSVKDETKAMLEDLGIKVIIFNPANIDNVIKNIETVAKVANV